MPYHGTRGPRLAVIGPPGRAAAAGVRLVAPDRPGFGRSDFLPGRRYRDWPGDVVALADSLGWGRFGVLGYSSGAPHVAVCALDIPDRLVGAALVSGDAALDDVPVRRHVTPDLRVIYWLARRAPWVMRVGFAGLAATLRRCPELAWRFIAHDIGTGDRRDAARMQAAARQRRPGVAIAEAFCSGTRGVVHELAIEGDPRGWGFRLEDVTFPVHVWHGDRDRLVPLPQGEATARRLPNARFTVVADAGHYLVWSAFDAIVADLLAGAGTAPK